MIQLALSWRFTRRMIFFASWTELKSILRVICPPRWIGGEVFDPNYEKANIAIADAVKKHPDRLIGFGRVNPNWGARGG